MKKNKLIVIYFVILAAQIIVSNTLGFEQYFLINVLPAMIMMLPTSVSTRKALFIAFLSGLAVDVTTEGVMGQGNFIEGDRIHSNDHYPFAYPEPVSAYLPLGRRFGGNVLPQEISVFHYCRIHLLNRGMPPAGTRRTQIVNGIKPL